MEVRLDDVVEKRIYEEATLSLIRKQGLDCAWFAKFESSESLVVGFRNGAISEASDKTILRPRCGVGGLVYSSNQTRFVDSYTTSTSITHDYDASIEAERLKRVVGTPVWADGRFFGVLMSGSRDEGSFGNRVTTLVEAAACRVSNMLIAAVLRQRLAVLGLETRRTEARLHALEEQSGKPLGGIRTREREVLQRVELGQTNREIAEGMHLSECTVKSYLRNAMQRLGARNRTEAIAFARSAGLI